MLRKINQKKYKRGHNPNSWFKKGHKTNLGKKLPHSEETKRKIKETHSHYWLSKKMSKEHKKKLSEAHKGKKLSEETKRRMSIAQKGKIISEEQKEKIRQNRANQKFPFKNTSIEIKVQNFLKENNIKFETQYPIWGQPDIFIKPNIAIFCDGDYWHNSLKARERDNKINKKLQEQGYIVIRLWGHEIRNNNFQKLCQLK